MAESSRTGSLVDRANLSCTAGHAGFLPGDFRSRRRKPGSVGSRRRQVAWLILCGAPLLLNLLAAALHRYPYGAGRLSQHLAPGLCLLAGLGAAALIARVKRLSPAKCTLALAGSFACIGLIGM